MRNTLLRLGVVAALLAGGLALSNSARSLSSPRLSVGSASVVNGDTNMRLLAVPVTLSAPAHETVTVTYTVSNADPNAPADFDQPSGRLVFPVDDQTGLTPLIEYIPIAVHPNVAQAANETVNVALSDASNATIDHGQEPSYVVPDGRRRSTVSVASAHIYRGEVGTARVVLLPITISNASNEPVTVHYAVEPLNATAGSDYISADAGDVTFEPGTVEKMIPIIVLPADDAAPASEYAVVKLTGASRAFLDVSDGYVELRRDDATTQTAAPVVSAAAPAEATAAPAATLPPTTAPPATTIAPPPAPDAAPPPSAGTLFDDEFDGGSLDLSKWQPNWLGAGNDSVTPPVNGEEASCYDPSQVSVSGGYLHLKAEARSCTANGKTYSYASGLVNSRSHFTFTHGHLEARVFVPGNGSAENWPAFWADGTGTWPSTGELDVMEGLHGGDCYHFHSPSGGPGGCAQLSPASGWHTFAADWRSGSVTYFYDGQQVGQVTQGITDAPMFLILNLGLSSSISPPVNAPSEMLVDYVRVTS